jgi:hypothetical protein
MSNGDPNKEEAFISVNDPSNGWAHFYPGKRPPPIEVTPRFLSNVLKQWMKDHPDRKIYNTLGIVRDGMTVELHVWYDETTPTS